MYPAIASIASALLLPSAVEIWSAIPASPSRRSSNASSSSSCAPGELVGRVEALDPVEEALRGAAVAADLGLEVQREVFRSGLSSLLKNVSESCLDSVTIASRSRT